MKKAFILVLLACVIAACVPSQEAIEAAIAQTQAASTPIPSQTPYATQTPYPTQTKFVVTQVFVWTPTSDPNDSSCVPIRNMDYSDNSKIAINLQAYVSSLPGVKSVSFVIPEKLYINTLSELFFVNYVNSYDNKVYSKRYIVYLSEFGWKNAVFSIDGQCWIDPPY